MNEELQRAKGQRLVALKNALDTVRQFAEPSLSPEPFEWFEKIEKSLLTTYSK